jgi:hypothetical protein
LPAVACIPPWAMKEIMELFGWSVIAEDEYNWVLSDSKDHIGVTDPTAEIKEPIILPKLGDLLAVDVMMDTLVAAKLDLQTYFALKDKVLGSPRMMPPSDQPNKNVN